MEVVKSILINQRIYNGRTSIANFSINTDVAKARTISFFASGSVQTQSRSETDSSIFLTGFSNAETDNVWSATLALGIPRDGLESFSISGTVALAFKDIDLFWRVNSHNSMILRNCSLIVGLSENKVKQQVDGKNIGKVDKDGIPITDLGVDKFK